MRWSVGLIAAGVHHVQLMRVNLLLIHKGAILGGHPHCGGGVWKLLNFADEHY